MNDLLNKLLWGQLQSIDLFKGGSIKLKDSKKKAGIRDRYIRWLEESLSLLSSSNYLRYAKGEYFVNDMNSLDLNAAWKEWELKKGAWLKDPNLKARINLVEATLKALPQIITGKTPVTDIMFPNSSMELVEGIYKNNINSDYFNGVLADTVVAYVKEHISQGLSKSIRILEVGAGTGGTSAMVFEKLKPYQKYIQEYLYTDISKAFLMHAEKEYGNENPYLTYKLFNVELPIAGQGIDEGGFDIVIATNVLHATKSIRQTLRNVKAVMKTNGLIMLNELSCNSIFLHLTFGLLDGWWLYEDSALRIPGCPAIAPETWRTVLENEGFRSAFFPAEEAHNLGQQIIVAESDGIVRQINQSVLMDMSVKKSESGEACMSHEKLETPEKRKKHLAPYKPIHATHDVSDQMIDDQVRTIIRESIARALKMEEGMIQDNISFSDYGVDSIIAVSLVNLINKQCGITLQTTVIFDYNNVDRLVRYIIQKYRSALLSLVSGNNSCAKIYSQESGLKVKKIKHKMHYSQIQTGNISSDIMKSGNNHSGYYRVYIEKPGSIEDLKITEAAVTELNENEVRIAVRAFSINFGDSLCVKGLYPTMPPYPFTPGFEASGIVVEVGHAVTTAKPGDEVIVLMGETLGAHANMITCSENQVFLKPQALTFEEACSLPIVSITVIDAFHKADLKKGEKILIQTAAGGIGMIAVQLAQNCGAEIYATAGSENKLNYLRKLGVSHVINYQENDFEEEIKQLTLGKGVDVVINTLSGDAIQKGMNCLAPGGRYVELAMTALKSARSIDLSILSNNQVFYSVDLRKLMLQNYDQVSQYLKEMIQLVADKIIFPKLYSIFPFTEIKEAYHCLENRENIGKIVVSIPEAYQYKEEMFSESGSNQKTWSNSVIQQEPVAIIGLSGRYAKTNSLNDFWQHLAKGTELIEEVTRWDLNQYYSIDEAYCKHGSFLSDIDKFDALFFNISGVEAANMDPQQRIFLEEAWKALEDAGYAGEGMQGRQCGIYVGSIGGDYERLLGDQPPAQAMWGNSGSVIPARIAYYLDLQGPAIAVDTACSSSLVAIHLACQSLWNKETEMALAGGIFVQCTPEFYLRSNQAGMLSSSGHCHTFDEQADGFVPGEGAGVVVLKRLQEAIRDGDHIYGVIRGSGINQDGTTNGITAPSANSQERLECCVYDNFKINPEDIQMVEAHGTGTKLGDPIEYQALTQAFRKYTEKNEYCAIGSVKTNIGHTAAAAGIAGLTKILLSLKHKQIPPSLNFQNGNSHIQFAGSPFYVNTQLKNWEAGANSKRCAVLSSFGFSGTNAHMVIEEAPISVRLHSEKPGYLIVLSARTSEQLYQQVEQLVEFCEKEAEADCGNMSYTLLMGRKHFKHRLACVIRSQQELITLFKKWLDKGQVRQIYVSEVNYNEQRQQASLIKFGNQCIRNCRKEDNAIQYLEQLSTIAELYVQGYGLEYEQLFISEQYSRISLPAYPFAKERYWVSGEHVKSATAESLGNTTFLHPLLQQNTSDLMEQRYSSTFTGREFFFKDYTVQGKRILSGAACLEMARTAIEQATGSFEKGKSGILLKNMIWAKPIAIDDQLIRVHIGVYPEENQEIGYEIFSLSDQNSTEPEIYGQGSAVLTSMVKETILDLAKIQNECQQSILNCSQYYEILRDLGIEDGSGYQAIQTVYMGRDQILARLLLPSSLSDTEDQYVLHPIFIDSALQVSMMLGLDKIKSESRRISLAGLVLPLALQETEIVNKCSSNMWAFIRYTEGSKAADKVPKMDIDFCDDQGRVCIRIKGFSSQFINGAEVLTENKKDFGLLLAQPVWVEKNPPKEMVYHYSRHVVLLCEPNEVTKEGIETQMNGVCCLALKSSQDSIEDCFQTHAVKVFEEIQSILRGQRKGKSLIQIVVSEQNEEQFLTGLSGILKTARLENPKIVGQLIKIEPEVNLEEIVEKLRENSQSPMDSEIRYQNGRRYVSSWSEIEVSERKEGIPWKDGGIYLITGGAGGLGQIFAKEIAQKAEGVTLVLTGRSDFNDDRKAQCKEIAAFGARVEYKSVDVSVKEEVVGLIRDIEERYGQINGIIHSAGVIRDNFIIKKTQEEMREVLAPKVKGLVNLDQASKDVYLDFFILFSSVVGVSGNAGQADYSAANAFMDAYAKYRNNLVKMKKRQGQTLSINWPLWREGGMQVDEENEKLIKQTSGMIAMQTSTGIKALYQGIYSGKDQIMVMEGDLRRIKTILQKSSAKVETMKMSEIDQRLLKEKTLYKLKIIFGEVTELCINRIDENEALESYGIDSIMITRLNQKLTILFGEIAKTLFFEYKTLNALTEYLVSDYREECMKWTGMKSEEQLEKLTPITSSNAEPSTSITIKAKTRRKLSFDIKKRQHEMNEPIAIVGVSGHYPKAANVKEYWENLRAGKDCITEIPEERWSLKGFYQPDPEEAIAQCRSYCKKGGFIKNFANFDPLFFNISPREARCIDPQERLFIETCWEVLEDAGYTKEQLASHYNGKIGVFAGITKTGFELYGPDLWRQGSEILPHTSFGSVANRISYLLNLHGPSIPIDTMCSSSLTAVHEACEHLLHDECKMAIVGGVNLYLHPSNFFYLCQLHMLSIDGSCQSFGKGADGFIGGEGVGAILLKRLSQAIQDRDHIYAVIRGSSINHGGKTNGYTVPNPAAQGELIRNAMDNAGVSARMVSYIEAHGTGTQLGDPIEISGLTQAFFKDTKENGFCSIGSVKSNIGHLEAAAGIAGITKIILQMKHKQIVPSLHAKELNPNINFAQTPFVVQQELSEWKRPIINGREMPRIAGISSFGAGGANAHVVLEEYIPRESQLPITVTSRNPAIIILSAKNEERLKEQAKRLLIAIKEEHFDEKDLLNMAYTLQVGREAMEERLAIIISTLKELEDKLQGYVDDRQNIEDVYQGQIKSNKDTFAIFNADEDMQKSIESWINKRKYNKILSLWVKGMDFDWNNLYGDIKPRRMSLPTYPFARERYWIPEISSESDNIPTSSEHFAVIHPLIQENTSDFTEQRYSSTFSGQEFFLRDHIVKGERILPGVVYLEMARVAVEKAIGKNSAENSRLELRNVVWEKPVVVGEQPVKINIGLYPQENGEIAYQVYSEAAEEVIMFNEGSAVYIDDDKEITLDLEKIQVQCKQSTFAVDQLYEVFRKMGIEYGTAHRGIEEVYIGEDQVLARISLPLLILDTMDQYVLHPALMDSALQASLGLSMISETIARKIEHQKPMVPFALDKVIIFNKCTSVMWALIRHSKESTSEGNVEKLDIDLCNEKGQICVQLRGFTSKIMQGEAESSIPHDETHSNDDPINPDGNTIMLKPVWDVVPVSKGQMFPASIDKVVIISGKRENIYSIQKLYPQAVVVNIDPGDSIEEIEKKIKGHEDINHIIWIASNDSLVSVADNTLIENQMQGVIQVFRLIKALLHSGYGEKELGWSVITVQTQAVSKNDSVNPTNAGVHGLVGSMAKEYTNWSIRLVDLEDNDDWPLADIFVLPADPKGNAWVYRRKNWYRQQLIPLKITLRDQTLYKKGGVYVVIGGAGGIGEAWTEYMIRTYQAKVIWLGRRKKDAVIQAKLDKLSSSGSVPIYLQADATDLKCLQKAYEVIKSQYVHINGVIHSAIVLKDRSLANMEEDAFRAALSAKVDVSVRMAQVFKNEPLDFVLFFSGIQTFAKAPGQSNYASGCCFKDAFAHQLSKECLYDIKTINWGYWGSVGIVASQAYQNRMAQAGIGSIEPPEAMEALEVLLAAPIEQIGLLRTTKSINTDLLNAGEVVNVYSDTHASCMHNMHIRDEVLPEQTTSQNDIDELLCRLLWGQLQSMGLFTVKQFTLSGLKQKIVFNGIYKDRWLEETMTVLVRNGCLQFDGRLYSVIDRTLEDLDVLWNEWNIKKEIWMKDDNIKAQVNLVEATMRILPNILTGKVPATDIMFPDSSLKLVEGIYKNNPAADYFNGVLANTVISYIENRIKQESNVQIRILEIGAGTGGTSSKVFTKLKPYQDHLKEYCYSDISQAFILHAEKEYGPENPYLTYKIFNVEMPINGQGIDAGGYDLVIATNVIHATKYIRQSLRNAKAVLKKNGLLILNEFSKNTLFAHLTFGLLEGWWLYEDSELRIPGSPGLYPQTWKYVLECEGFRSVLFPAKLHDRGQIIVAESDGVIRQQAYKPDNVPIKQNVKTFNSKQDFLKQNPVRQKNDSLTEELLREKSTIYIAKLVSETLKISSGIIDPSEPLENYGLDSIVVVQLANAMRKVIPKFSSTLFLEYQTIDHLVEYLIKNQKQDLLALVGAEECEQEQKITGDKLYDSLLPQIFTEAVKKTGRFGKCPAKATHPLTQQCGERDIAIIGVSGRYPQAENIEELWENLRNGKDCITEIPKDRWNHDLYFDADKSLNDKTSCKWGGFLKDIDKFDPLFFNISPREAERMDPQERLFIETVWNLFENIGYTRKTLQLRYRGQVGVYVGAMYQQYQSAVSMASYSSIANRVSYFFNLHGPSIAVDTACSSSAIAIHMACECLINRECEMAIAGGVNLTIHPKKYLCLSKAQMLGSDINSRSFSDGDGMLPAESVGAVLLKPLSKAVKDGDSILAVIKSTATNHGGHSNGFSVPNPTAQAQLLEDHFEKSGIDPRTVSYVESAANGSVLGDAVEFAALTKVFEKYTTDRKFCTIGSVKSNIGHPEAASGIAQLTKVILQLQHKKIVPTIKADPLNPNISFDNTPFLLQRELQEWKRPTAMINGEVREFPRRATVSSFGAGGSNAHMILEEYVPVEKEKITVTRTVSSPQIVIFSAKNRDRLKVLVDRMIEFIEKHDNLRLSDFAYTLQMHREAMECRLAVVVNTWEEVSRSLKAVSRSFKEGKEIAEGIPIFTEDLGEGCSRIKNLLSGESGQNLVETFLENREYEKIALYWSQGGEIPWELLHKGQVVQRISLPTYPFSKERYWISGETEIPCNIESAANSKEFSQIAINTNSPEREYIKNYIIQLLLQELHLVPDQINLNKNLQDYGTDSIVAMKIKRNLETRFQVKITQREMLEYRTINALTDYLTSKIEVFNKQETAADLDSLTKPDNYQVDNPEIEALKKFKNGTITLEEIEMLLDKGVIL